MIYRIASYVLLTIAATLTLFLLAAHLERRDMEKALQGYVRGELVAQGYAEGRRGKVRIERLPPGATGVATVAGSVRYPPTRGSGRPCDGPSAAASGAPPSPGDGGSPGSPTLPVCDLGALALDIRCRADIVEVAGKPFGRLFVSGNVQGWGQVRDLPELPAGDVSLAVAPAALPPRYAAELRAGLEVDWDGEARPVLGGSFYGRRRLGFWAQASPDGAGGGVAYRLGR